MTEDDDRARELLPLSLSLHQLDEAHRRVRNMIARRFELAGTELTALLVIAGTPGLSAGAIGQDLGITTGATTAVIDRLEDSGHVLRAPNPLDRRGVEVHLTPAGEDTVRDIATSYSTLLGAADLSDTWQSIVPKLDAITATLNAAVVATRSTRRSEGRHALPDTPPEG